MQPQTLKEFEYLKIFKISEFNTYMESFYVFIYKTRHYIERLEIHIYIIGYNGHRKFFWKGEKCSVLYAMLHVVRLKLRSQFAWELLTLPRRETRYVLSLWHPVVKNWKKRKRVYVLSFYTMPSSRFQEKSPGRQADLRGQLWSPRRLVFFSEE